MRAKLFPCVVAVLAAPTLAWAQAPSAALLVSEEGAPRARVERFQDRFERAVREGGHAPVVALEDDAIATAVRAGTVAQSRVEGFREVDGLLREARQHTLDLREEEALAALANARRIALDHADVPGATAWIAEVETALAITAARVGIDAIADTAFARAATLDRTRFVRAAEAPPALVERARAILSAQTTTTRDTGSFTVRCDPEGARVFLDDREVGNAPIRIEAPIGAHVLRVEAPGYVPWGALVDLLEGPGPVMDVALGRMPAVASAHQIELAARRGDLPAVSAGLASAGLDQAWVVRVGAGEQDRALLVRCASTGCEEPQRFELDEFPYYPEDPEWVRAAVASAELARAADWLGAPIPPVVPEPPPAWYERWYTWVGIAAAVAGIVIPSVAAYQRPVVNVGPYDVVVGDNWPAPASEP